LPCTASWRCGTVFDLDLIDERDGMIVLKVSGKTAAKVFANEAGGHRWQRIPPTEKRGRVHTSTITVAVLAEPEPSQFVLSDKDLEWTTCRGSGAGGQHRNVTDSAVQVKHLPSGLIVRCESERSQMQNRASAAALLRARLAEQAQANRDAKTASNRRAQVGSGMRADKRRTIRQQDNQVNDHLTGQHWRYDEYIKGAW
jgi:peptide chain release factor 1